MTEHQQQTQKYSTTLAFAIVNTHSLNLRPSLLLESEGRVEAVLWVVGRELVAKGMNWSIYSIAKHHAVFSYFSGNLFHERKKVEVKKRTNCANTHSFKSVH